MKKALAILFMLAGLTGLVYGGERFWAAMKMQERAETSMEKIKGMSDMQQMEGEKAVMDVNLGDAADAKQTAMIYGGGGVGLLLLGIIILAKSGRPKTALGRER